MYMYEWQYFTLLYCKTYYLDYFNIYSSIWICRPKLFSSYISLYSILCRRVSVQILIMHVKTCTLYVWLIKGWQHWLACKFVIVSCSVDKVTIRKSSAVNLAHKWSVFVVVCYLSIACLLARVLLMILLYLLFSVSIELKLLCMKMKVFLKKQILPLLHVYGVDWM